MFNIVIKDIVESQSKQSDRTMLTIVNIAKFVLNVINVSLPSNDNLLYIKLEYVCFLNSIDLFY